MNRRSYLESFALIGSAISENKIFESFYVKKKYMDAEPNDQ